MNPNTYQELAKRTQCPQPVVIPASKKPLHPNSGSILHSSIGISNEAGEIASIMQKWIWYGQELNVNHLAEELGDLLWYIAEGCNALSLKMGDVLEANINKLRIRYPANYADYLAENRNREKEAAAMDQRLNKE